MDDVESNDMFSDVPELSVADDGLIELDETRVRKRRKGPSINFKELYDKYIK